MPPCRMCGARWDVRTVETSPARTAGTGVRPGCGDVPAPTRHGHTQRWTGPPFSRFLRLLHTESGRGIESHREMDG